MACSTSGSPIANSSPAIIRSRTWRAIHGWCRTRTRARTSTTYRISSAGSRPFARGPRRVLPYKTQSKNIDDFPHLKRCLETIRERPATVRAYAKAKEVNPNYGQPAIRTEEERKLLFVQTAGVVEAP